RDRLHEAWIEFLDSLVGDRPAVVLVEDIHWAEPPLLDLIEQLVRGVAGPLLLVATARPEFVAARAGWGGGRYDAETTWLGPQPSSGGSSGPARSTTSSMTSRIFGSWRTGTSSGDAAAHRSRANGSTPSSTPSPKRSHTRASRRPGAPSCTPPSPSGSSRGSA